MQRKKENWVVLNQKVLKKLGIDISKDEIEKLCAGADKAAEKCARNPPDAHGKQCGWIMCWSTTLASMRSALPHHSKCQNATQATTAMHVSRVCPRPCALCTCATHREASSCRVADLSLAHLGNRLLGRVKSAIENGPQPHPPKKRAVEMLPAPAAAKPKGKQQQQQAKDAGGVGEGRKLLPGGNGHKGGPERHFKKLASPPPAPHADKGANRRMEAPVVAPVRGRGSSPARRGDESSGDPPDRGLHQERVDDMGPPRGGVGGGGGRHSNNENQYWAREGGGEARGGEEDMRRLLLDMASYNLGQFDLHRCACRDPTP